MAVAAASDAGRSHAEAVGDGGDGGGTAGRHPAQAATPSNVALGATVTLRGDAFFTGGWGGGLVPPQTITDGVFLRRGTQRDQGAVWWDQYQGRFGEIVIDLGRRYRIESIVVQADDNDASVVDAATRHGWRTLWRVPTYDAFGAGMQTRPDPGDDAAVLASKHLPSVSEVQAFGVCR